MFIWKYPLCHPLSPRPCLLSVLKGKEIIEYYLRELEEEGVTYIPRWTPPVVSSTAMAVPVKAGPDSRDPSYTSEQVVDTPDGRSSKCWCSPDLFALIPQMKAEDCTETRILLTRRYGSKALKHKSILQC